MIKKTFKIALYSHFKIHVIVANDFELAIKTYIKRLKVEGLEKAGGLFIYEDIRPWEGIILVSPNTATSTIAHESFHATYRIMSMIGSELANESEEPYAYLVGHITNMVVKSLLEYDKKFPEQTDHLLIEGIENDIVIEVDNK